PGGASAGERLDVLDGRLILTAEQWTHDRGGAGAAGELERVPACRVTGRPSALLEVVGVRLGFGHGGCAPSSQVVSPRLGFALGLQVGGRAGGGWAAGQGEGEPSRLAARLGPDAAGGGKGGDDRQAPASLVTRAGLAGPGQDWGGVGDLAGDAAVPGPPGGPPPHRTRLLAAGVHGEGGGPVVG